MSDFISSYIISESGITTSVMSATTYYGSGIGITDIPISGVTNLQTELSAKISGATNLSAEGVFAQKNGLSLEFKGLTSTGSTLTITSDSNTINLETILPQDVFVYSGNANVSNSTLSFLNTTGGTFTVTNSAALFADNDINVTGGTYNPSTGCVTFATNSGTTFNVCGFLTGMTDTYVTGFTYNNANTLTITRNDGANISTSINIVTGLTSTGSISATTYYGDGSNLTGIAAAWDGLEVITVGENVSQGDLLYLSSGSTYLKASNTSEVTTSTELRIAVENILSGQTGNGLIQGKYTTSGLTAGEQYWVGASNGSYTNIQPSGDGDIVRYVGTALNSTILEFKPDETWIEISSASTPSIAPPTQPAIKNVTTSYNILSTDYTINVTTTGDTTQTLPLSVSLIGKIYNIKNSDSTGTSTITIATTSGELIDNLYGGGNDLQTIFPQSIKLQSTGSGWIII